MDQLEMYKKYHNMEVKQMLYTESDEQESENKNKKEEVPKWYSDIMASQKG